MYSWVKKFSKHERLNSVLFYNTDITLKIMLSKQFIKKTNASLSNSYVEYKDTVLRKRHKPMKMNPDHRI